MDIIRLDLNKKSHDPPTANEIAFHAGVLAAVPTVVVCFIARFIFNAPLVPELLAQFLFAISPIWLVEVAVGMFGSFAKHFAFLGCSVIYLLALIGAGIGYLRCWPGPRSTTARWISASALAVLMFLVTVCVLIPVVDGGMFGSHLQQGWLVTSSSILVSHVVYGIALAVACTRYIDRPTAVTPPNSTIVRRRLIRGIGYSVLAVGIYDIGRSLLGSWLRSGGGRVRRGSGVLPNIDNLALEITPTSDFYVVSKNAFDPQVDSGRWRLEVRGLVEHTLSLTYEEIKALPSIEQYATLACISNEVGGDLIGNASWRGVRLKDVLEKAGLRQRVADVVLRASDNYSDSIPLERAMAEGTLLVYEMNGEPLTSEHGFPVRLLVPGIYGMKNIKWITSIEAVDHDFKGYWQRRGWDDQAEYKTMSRIDAPSDSVRNETIVAGIAFAGDRGISKVDVSTDGGKTWQTADLKPALSAISWVLWHIKWTPPGPGKHRIVARATDGGGVTQTAQRATPAPSGSTGFPSLTVESE